MLSKNVKIVDIDPRQYENLVSAVMHGRRRASAGPALIVFYRENEVVHAVHTGHGPLPDFNYRGPGGLGRMAEEYSVKRVVCLETGALRRLANDAQLRLDYSSTLWEIGRAHV